MKVGVDGTLLGAWADCRGARHILDAGTGCGLIALMLAQRFGDAEILAAEIEADAAQEAADNFSASPWEARITLMTTDLTRCEELTMVDHIVSNPPFFDSGVDASASARMLARHTKDFSPEWLLENARRMLRPEGLLSMIFPRSSLAFLVEKGEKCGMYLRRCTVVRGHETAPPKRVLAEFGNAPAAPVTPSTLILEQTPGTPTDEYRELCKDFYLKF